MSRSLLGSFVSGTRQVLFVQLFVSVGAVSLAGWTLAVTNDLIRERASLNDRVIQLEEELAKNNIVPPSVRVTEATPDTQDAYPPPTPEAPVEPAAPSDGAQPVDETGRPVEPAPPPTETPGSRGEASANRPNVVEAQPFNPATILFAPAPPLRTIVLHVRAQEDSALAQRIARELSSSDVRVAIDVMPPRDPRQSGYAYFDGRQSRAAAQTVQAFNDVARRHEIAPWAVQLRGVALPAQGEYTADRLDIVLPPLPRIEPASPIDPRTVYRERAPG